MWAGAGPIAGWIALVALGCADPPHPLEARCLEALAYRSPVHGDIESMERTPTETGTAVTIRYRAPDSAAGPPHRYVLCEFAAGDRWALQQMIHEGEVLPESELALVNSDLLLQDLTQNPERFVERAHLVPKPVEPVATGTPDASEMQAESAEPDSGSRGVGARSPTEPNSVAVRSPNGDPSHPSLPASQRTILSEPRPQIPSPSSGGSD